MVGCSVVYSFSRSSLPWSTKVVRKASEFFWAWETVNFG